METTPDNSGPNQKSFHEREDHIRFVMEERIREWLNLPCSQRRARVDRAKRWEIFKDEDGVVGTRSRSST